MLKLAWDFTRRAVTTVRGEPIAEVAARDVCQWSDADLLRDVSGVVLTNELDQLSASVLGTANKFQHSRGRAFQDHLQGVAGLLQRWQQDALTVQIGLFHSAYSTQQYPYGLYSYADRDSLRELVGVDAERLVFLFCSHDRVDLYAQAVELARAGAVLPEHGLELRNALTGQRAQVPATLIAPLLVVHAADLAEQMEGFDFDMIAALLAVAAPLTRVPDCLAALLESGYGGSNLQIRIQPQRGTLGLAPVLGLNRRLLGDRIRLRRLLSGQGALNREQEMQLDALDARLPGLFEIPWIRYVRGGADQQATETQRVEARQRLVRWGVPWLKGPFDNNPDYERLLQI